MFLFSNFGSQANLQKVWENAVRKGSNEQWLTLFNDILSDEQRQAVMEGEIWPPHLYAGVALEGDDDEHYSHGPGLYEEAVEIVYEDEDGNEIEFEEEEEYEADGDEL